MIQTNDKPVVTEPFPVFLAILIMSVISYIIGDFYGFFNLIQINSPIIEFSPEMVRHTNLFPSCEKKLSQR